jgi:tetratricopeptide (TPR) repeat protein
LYWANVATHTNDNYQAIFPPSVQVVTYHAKNDFAHWPVSHEVYQGQDFSAGVDISYWKNSKRANSYFAHDLKEDFMGGYDHGLKTGTVHIGDHNIVKGAKLWEWGSGELGQSIEAQLNENAGPYVELMVGAFSDNQPDYSWIRPYEVKTVQQYWYPIKDIGGFKNANLNGAVNLEKREGNTVFLAYYATQKIDRARVVLKNKGEIVRDTTITISPEEAFTETIALAAPIKLTDLYTELVNEETGAVLLSYQPLELVYPEELPETVKPPRSPREIGTTEELFLTGQRIEQFYHPRLDPMHYYEEALSRDPGDIRTNTAVGNIYLKNGDYLQARQYFSQAIKRLTKDYTRPSDGETLYLQGITLKALGLHDEAIDTLYRATWDYAFQAAAFLELARISVMRGNDEKALWEVNESLATNARNNSAISLKAALQRRAGHYQGATQTMQSILQHDPLDFRAANEAYLIAKASANQTAAEQKLAWLREKMRDYQQNYLDLAVSYLNDGLNAEAEEVLLRFKGTDPIISYYLGYLSDQKGDRAKAQEHFASGSEQSVDFCFPFRLETIPVLEMALRYHPTDGRAYYYLGNILYNKQPEKAIAFWEKAAQYDPRLAIVHRNLGWGHHHFEGDGQKAMAAYEKALALKRDDPMYYVELDQLYELGNVPIEKRLQLFAGANEVVRQREDAFARQIAVLTLGGQAEKAVEYLSDRAFTFNESSQRVYDIIADAHLALGLQYLKEGHYAKALKAFENAEVPEELGFFGNSGNRNMQVKYFMGLTYEAMRKKSKARTQFRLNTELDPGTSPYVQYYQGLSYAKLGKKAEAEEIFQTLLREAEKEINQEPEEGIDFFAKFGGQQAENARLSEAYLLLGLGHKGLGDLQQASDYLQKAINLSASNLYAVLELQNL